MGNTSIRKPGLTPVPSRRPPWALASLRALATLGPAMAVALLTTFYGAVLANMVFLPLASKLERNSTEEALVNNIYLMGSASIGRQENPRRLEMLLNSLLPPSQRVRYFD